MINSKDISIVVQGAIDKIETPKSLKSIRKIFSNAEIILSTWKGSDISNLEGLYDIVIFNEDQEVGILSNNNGKTIYNNLNRQLFSTQEGIKKATRKYILKLRSDLILSNDRFLNYFDMFQNRIDEYKLFKRKILTSTLFTRFEYKTKNGFIELPFHISDWWFFGLKEDIEEYFLNTPLVKEPDFTNYFAKNENLNKNNPYGNMKFKFSPEQYFGYTCFSNNFNDIKMQDASDTNKELFEKFRKCLVNNFIILEFKQSGIYNNKYYYSKCEKVVGEHYFSLYTFNKYENEYKELCDKNYKLSSPNFLFTDKKILYAYGKLLKHYYLIFAPDICLSKKINEIFFKVPMHILLFLVQVLRGNFKNAKYHL